ncbi:MAG: hypothetical protein WBL33_16080, partial [Candidatus Acidiferrales bacterium]
MIRFISRAIIGVGLMAGGATVQAQTTGPITPPPTFELKRIPVKPAPAPPPIPAEQIIQRFTQDEDLNKKAYDADMFDQSVKVEELVSNGGFY